MTKTQYLIIGGGFAGAALAQRLQKQGMQTMLVDRKDYFEVTYATLRDATAPERLPHSPRKRYDDFLDGNFVQSGVISLTPTKAYLDNGTTVSFEKAIIATGSRYPSLSLAKSASAFTAHAREQEMKAIHKKLYAANEVLIIGGGVVGVELAGEVAHAYPDKDIILAHNKSSLLDTFKPKAQKLAHQQLSALGVTIKTDTNYAFDGQRYIDSNGGEALTPDVVYSAVGTLPNSEFLNEHLSSALDKRGYVKVDKQFRVLGYDTLYALGDVADTGSFKLGYIAGIQAEQLAKNLLSEQTNKPVKPYKPMDKLLALVPTGPESGLVQLPFAVTKANFLVNIKQKDLFISKTYSGLHTQPESIQERPLTELTNNA